MVRMLHIMVELIHILSCIRTRTLLCFLYRLLILGNIFVILLTMLKITLQLVTPLMLINMMQFSKGRCFSCYYICCC
jgi:hypothetical protein